MNEIGKDSATGIVRVRINPKYYRPTEVVRSRLLGHVSLSAYRTSMISLAFQVSLQLLVHESIGLSVAVVPRYHSC